MGFIGCEETKKPDDSSGFLWYHLDSNQGHKDFQSFALPTELWYPVGSAKIEKEKKKNRERHFFSRDGTTKQTVMNKRGGVLLRVALCVF